MRKYLMLLAPLLATLSAAPLQARWYEATGAHFVVYADGSEKDVQRFAERLERYDKALRFFTKTGDDPVGPAGRVSVYLLRDQDALAKLTGNADIGGIYKPRAGDAVAFAPRPTGADWLRGGVDDSTLFHEYAHHFMLSTWPSAAFPAWFVEGFAEMVGSAVIGESGGVTIGMPPGNASWDLNRENHIPAAKLLVADPSVQSLTNGFYGRAWLLTHYLMLGGAERAALGRYIAAISDGASPAEAAKAFGDPASLDKRVDAYAKRHSLPGIPIPGGSLNPGQVTVRPLSAAEAALMPVQIRSAYGVGPKGAIEVATLARQLAAPYPNDPDAQRALAQAEFDAGRFTEAQAAAERALAADPKSVDALLLKGQAQMMIAAHDGVTDPARWAAIRKTLAKAIGLDRTDPRPLIAYHRTFWESRAEPTRIAKDALSLASTLAPQDIPLRYRVGRTLVNDGEAAEALSTLRAVANDPHAPEASARTARRLVEALLRDDLAAARAIVKETSPQHADGTS